MYSICTENLIKRYGNKDVLKGVNLRIREGEFYALMGPNGSGKTTLVSILAGVKAATSGKVEIYGETPDKARRLIGYIPQRNFSCPDLTGRENLIYFTMLYGYSKKQAENITEELLRKVELLEEADKKAILYSGGMRKKLEIATALLPGMKIFILDEPTTGLDPAARRNFFGLLRSIKDDKTTILLITHIGTDAELASRIGLLNKGKIVAEGTAEELKSASGLKSVINIETLIKSKEIADALKRFSKDSKVLETDEGYRVYCDDINKTIPEIIRFLGELGCKVTHIEAVEPSLEDVFFKMTGENIKEAKK